MEPETSQRTPRHRHLWRLVALSIVLLVLLATLHLIHDPKEIASEPAPTTVAEIPAPVPTTPEPTVVSVESSEPVQTVPSGRSLPPPPDPQATERQIAATNRMIAAHTSLRAPEVADPESATNRRTLQNLVAMAQARKIQPPEEVAP